MPRSFPITDLFAIISCLALKLFIYKNEMYIREAWYKEVGGPLHLTPDTNTSNAHAHPIRMHYHLVGLFSSA